MRLMMLASDLRARADRAMLRAKKSEQLARIAELEYDVTSLQFRLEESQLKVGLLERQKRETEQDLIDTAKRRLADKEDNA